MRKERMTKTELEQLLKENKTVKLVCDDGHFTGTLKEIEVIVIHNERIIFMDNEDSLQSFSANNLEHYPSQKPERETIDLYWTFDNCGNKCLCNSNGFYPNFTTKQLKTTYSYSLLKHKDEKLVWEQEHVDITSDEYKNKNKSFLEKEFKRLRKKGNL